MADRDPDHPSLQDDARARIERFKKQTKELGTVRALKAHRPMPSAASRYDPHTMGGVYRIGRTRRSNWR